MLFNPVIIWWWNISTTFHIDLPFDFQCIRKYFNYLCMLFIMYFFLIINPIENMLLQYETASAVCYSHTIDRSSVCWLTHIHFDITCEYTLLHLHVIHVYLDYFQTKFQKTNEKLSSWQCVNNVHRMLYMYPHFKLSNNGNALSSCVVCISLNWIAIYIALYLTYSIIEFSEWNFLPCPYRWLNHLYLQNHDKDESLFSMADGLFEW